jgi:hypothetical protein
MNAERSTVFAVIIAVGVSLVVEKAEAQAYRAQGTITYRFLNPGEVKPSGSGTNAEYRRVSQFDLHVNGCLFHFRVVDVSGGSDGIEYYEVGTDGKDLFQQTVYKQDDPPEKRPLLRADKGEQRLAKTEDSRKPVNKSAGRISSGVVPRNRFCHEGAIWFALSSHCTYTNERGLAYRLRDYGDNEFQSFTSTVSLVSVKFPSSPRLFQQAALLDPPRRGSRFSDRQIQNADFTNASYVVTETMSVGGLVLPKRFTFTHMQRLWSDVSYAAADSAMYIGEVTNAWEGSTLTTYKPSLVTPASLSDHRFYRREPGGNLAPVTGLFHSWEEISRVKEAIPLSTILSAPTKTLQP